eukprot:352494-Chlamydomonas_euryale.AAC.4
MDNESRAARLVVVLSGASTQAGSIPKPNAWTTTADTSADARLVAIGVGRLWLTSVMPAALSV